MLRLFHSKTKNCHHPTTQIFEPEVLLSTNQSKEYANRQLLWGLFWENSQADTLIVEKVYSGVGEYMEVPPHNTEKTLGNKIEFKVCIRKQGEETKSLYIDK